MMQENNIGKYSSISSSGRSTRELMVLILQKAKNHLITAKKSLEEKDFVEVGKDIILVLQILENLAKISSLDDSIPDIDKVQKMYETLSFQIENLVAKRAEPKEYDYFIDYFERLKNSWENFEYNAPDSRVDANVYISSQKEKTENVDIKHDNMKFDINGKFEVLI